MKVYVSVNYDNGDYMAEIWDKRGFSKLYEGGVLADIVEQSKGYIERNCKQGSVIALSEVYNYNGKEWKHIETVRF